LQMSTFRGKFTRTTGKVVLDRAAGTGTVDVTIDPASIDFGVPAMNANARGSDWFNVGQFPTITYKGTISRFDGDQPAQVDGELTMLGVTRPVRLQMTSFRCMQHAVLKREMCGGDATGVLDRRDFG
ncbi:YceI family protein, partial [Acinetobacter baumannii]|uniref:YceI family protein n=1 Tax=Acinetobacter baumannii TaxID=470 RepID=UPI001898A9AE